ncbi:MAG: nuclear transport factor 2 family protein [Bacteroidota bacterium]
MQSILFVLLAGLGLMSVKAQNSSSDEAAIKQVITSFSTEGDAQNVAALEPLLHDAYRVVFNRAFGTEETKVFNREQYLSMITQKKIGGDTRKVTFLQVDIHDHIATAKVELNGSKANFTSYFSLVKSPTGTWQLVGDMPIAVFK